MSTDTNTLRSAVIKLAHANPELRPHLLPLLKQGMEFDTKEEMEKYRATHDVKPSTKLTVKKPQDSDKTTPIEGVDPEHGVLMQSWADPTRRKLTHVGQVANQVMDHVGKQVESGVVPTRHHVEKAQEHVKKYVAKAKHHTTSERSEHIAMSKALQKLHQQTRGWHPDVHTVMSDHDLEDTDSDQLKKFKGDKPSTGKPLSDQQLMAKFLAKAKPETKERMKGMSVADFKRMYAAINADEE